MRRSLVVLSLPLALGMMGTLQRPVSAGPASASPQEVAAQVNGKSITYQELNAEFLARTKARFESVQNNPRAQQARKEILDDIINGELLVQEAERQKIRVAPQAIEERFEDIRARFPSEEAFKQYLGASGLTPERLKARIRDELLRQRLITKEILEGVSVSPQELETFFNDHRDDYSQEEEVHVRHILVVVTPDASPEEDQKAKDRAKAVLAKARKGEDFAKLATEYSDGPTKAREGDLGYFGRGQTVKPFEEAAFKLKVGEISDLVRTQFGYHIIKAEGRREAKQLSFTEAKDQVREDLTREKTYTRYQDYLKELRRKSKLTVNLR